MGLTMDLESLLVRRHKCEKCGRVYQCLECQAATEKIRAYNLNDIALYSLNHMPKPNNAHKLWLCENCE